MGYAKSYIFKNTFEKLQKELHYSHKQMHHEFPDLTEKVRLEELENIEKNSLLILNKVRKLKKYK